MYATMIHNDGFAGMKKRPIWQLILFSHSEYIKSYTLRHLVFSMIRVFTGWAHFTFQSTNIFNLFPETLIN